MKEISILGIDLAKNIFHIHGADKDGNAVLRKKLTRGKLSEFLAQLPICIVAMEACGTAHYWGRKIQKLGHEVRLINPAFVIPFVKSNKNDFNDAEAIAEACSRPTMRFVPIKTIKQQEILFIHKIRERVISSRTRLSNQLRSILAELGFVCRKGLIHLKTLTLDLINDKDEKITPFMKELLKEQLEELNILDEKVKLYEKQLADMSKKNASCKRLMEIPGIGPICATALYAFIGKGHDFKKGRDVSAFLGLVPGQKTTGGKPKLLGITKRGNQYLRKQLIHGARSVICRKKIPITKTEKWLQKLELRRPKNVVTVALANKNARIAWAILNSGERYQPNKIAKAG